MPAEFPPHPEGRRLPLKLGLGRRSEVGYGAVPGPVYTARIARGLPDVEAPQQENEAPRPRPGIGAPRSCPRYY